MNSGLSIPYNGHHCGPRRLLTLSLRRGLLGSRGAHVTVDGRTHVLPWGSAVLEVPADRPVVISVHQGTMSTVGLATTTLMPHDPPELEYRSPRHVGFAGDIGAPGATRARGAGCLAAMIVVAVLGSLVALVVFLVIVP